MPNNSRIGSKQPKKENINTEETRNKKHIMSGVNVFQPSSPKNKESKEKSDYQNRKINHHNNPPWEVA
jgi:hypothetical protein